MFFSDELPRFVYFFPRILWPFIQLSRPYHVSNVLAAALGGLLLATDHTNLAFWFLVYGLGTFLILGAGATFNDIVDRTIDAKYLKTMSRPIPSGRVSLNVSIAYFLTQLLFAFACWILLPTDVKVISLVILGLVLLYPFSKRFTNYAQFVLGFVSNLQVFMGYYMLEHKIDIPVIALYVCMSLIIVMADSVFEYREYFANKHPNIKSTAFAWGKNGKMRLFTIAFVYFGLMVLLGVQKHFNGMFFCAALISFVRILSIIYSVDLRNSADCNDKFLQLQNSGWFIFIAILCGQV